MFTGQGDSYASKSWWPTDSNWQANAPHTRWTEKFDALFEKRLKKIQEGTAEPLNYEKWRTDIRGSSSARRVNKAIDKAYEAFLETHLSA